MDKMYVIRDGQKKGIFQKTARFLVRVLIKMLGKPGVEVIVCSDYDEVVLRCHGAERLEEVYYTNLGGFWSKSTRTRDLGHEVGK